MLIEVTEEKKKTMTSTERSVIDWLNEHEEEIPNRSINEIADASFTSPATVSRAIRKCGFSGISEMKYKVSSKLNYIVAGRIVNEIFNRSITECQKTIEALNVDTILRVIRYIKFSEKIYILARGTTALIARDFEFQLQLLGYNAFVLSDSQIMRNSKKLFKKDDVVIIFTVKNSTPELEMSARFAKEKGAVVITCCCIPGTSLEEYSDLSVLGGNKNNSMIEEYNVMSRLPLHIISRTLIDYLML
ncbi:MurR/RpiR family transcriptional regulator [Hespellia stercorisuis]|uniref:Transcriptional regulator, RpiR family n=1 Tax=Hespellia stercorisuis DSM 15480 TaxID=1121950 RepID=A0A1M6SXV7_9FIRM|nr:MurR/RpiR family transcriptional regulator [Hespellia stercorisuis]SHK49551.1 transcriptional regulator, RpiR family [Hespellia stercorisuis DSM 15480]